ncbi:MAG: hypothetical protein ACI4EG_08585 [Fusicatenibacter sp.]
MQFQRINQGEALYVHEDARKKGDLANSGACFLSRCEKNDKILANLIGIERLNQPDLEKGCIVMIISADYEEGEGLWRRGKGLCILNTDFEVIYEKEEPVIPTTAGSIDERAVEDGRLMQIDDVFFLWYCGYNGIIGRACMAYSKDLIHWEKSAPLPGNINDCQNKDHVIFPDKIDGFYYMLHRPWGEETFGKDYNMPICLAKSDSLTGKWENLGATITPVIHADHRQDWLGAGAPPLKIGEGKYLELYHNAWYEKDGYRQYHASAATFDFQKGDPERPESLVTHRMESVLVPSTDFPNEINRELRLDIIFPMSCFCLGEDLIVIYGAGDRVTCAAKMNLKDLLTELEKHKIG